MANINAISQQPKITNKVVSDKNTGNPSAPEDSFQGMLDKVSGTETKETDSKETAEGGQNKTDTPVVKEEPVSDSKGILQTDLAALVIQSMVGKAILDQSNTVPENTAVTQPANAVQTAALPIVDTQIQADVAPVPIAEQKADNTQQKAVDMPVLTDVKVTPKAEDGRASAAADVLTKNDTKNPLPTVSEGISASANQSDKPITLEQTTQQQTGNQEQPKEPSSEVVKDTRTDSTEKTPINAEVKKEAEKTEITPEPTTVKNAPAQDTEVVRIKVAEPFKQVDGRLMNQISDKVQDTVFMGKDELLIQLTPEHLGKIAIKITMTDDGIKVLLNCDNLKTQNLLADKAAGIGKIVEDNMNSPVTVEVKDDGYWNQQKNATDQHNNQRNQQNDQEKQSEDDTDVFIQQLRLGLGGQLTAG